MSQTTPWQTSYRAGRWIVFAAPTCLVVSEPVNPDSEVVALWEDLGQTTTMEETCELLAAWGLDAVRSLGVIAFADGHLSVRLRGGLRIFDFDGIEVASGRQNPWEEVSLDCLAFTLECDEPTMESPEMPLALGAVLASRLRVRMLADLAPKPAEQQSIRRPAAASGLPARARESIPEESVELDYLNHRATRAQPMPEEADEASLPVGVVVGAGAAGMAAAGVVASAGGEPDAADDAENQAGAEPAGVAAQVSDTAGAEGGGEPAFTAPAEPSLAEEIPPEQQSSDQLVAEFAAKTDGSAAEPADGGEVTERETVVKLSAAEVSALSGAGATVSQADDDLPAADPDPAEGQEPAEEPDQPAVAAAKTGVADEPVGEAIAEALAQTESEPVVVELGGQLEDGAESVADQPAAVVAGDAGESQPAADDGQVVQPSIELPAEFFNEDSASLHTVTLRRHQQQAEVAVVSDNSPGAVEIETDLPKTARKRFEEAIAFAKLGSKKLVEITGLRQPSHGADFTEAVELPGARQAPDDAGRDESGPQSAVAAGEAVFDFDAEASAPVALSPAAEVSGAAEAVESVGAVSGFAAEGDQSTAVGDEASMNIDISLDSVEVPGAPGRQAAAGPGGGRQQPDLDQRDWVLAVVCPADHANPTGTKLCLQCGQPIDSRNNRWIRRAKALAVLAPDGTVWPVEQAVVVGRAPQDPERSGATLLRVISPKNDISRNHIRIERADQGVTLIDLNSTNGSVLQIPGREPVALTGGTSINVPLGTVIDLGDDQLLSVIQA